jgi:hypothetical protein
VQAAVAITSMDPTTAALAAAVPIEMVATVLGAALVLMALGLAGAILLALDSAGRGATDASVGVPVRARVEATVFPRPDAQLRPPPRDGLRASRPSRAPPDQSHRPRPTLPAEEPDA